MKLIENKSQLVNEFVKHINQIETVSKLIEFKNIYYKQKLTAYYEKIKTIDQSLKKQLGQELNELKNELEAIFEVNKSRLAILNDTNNNHLDYDINLETLNMSKGVNHLLNLTQNTIMDFFQHLNFSIVDGDEVVDIKDNFDNLNINKNHPARTSNDSFYIKDSLKMLRTHCTANTSQKICNHNSELKIVSYGNVYRNDDDDLTHSHQFRQIDFVWVKQDLSIANLKWLIDQLLKHIFGQDIKTRYRLSYFPFTEPSFEVDVSCFNCNGDGCNICKKSGWIEILGAGLLHQNVLDAANITFTKTALAAGFGLDRITMLKYGISDIRYLYNNDFRIIKQVKNFKGAK